MTADMDIVYICQAAERNEPLRYSLRSLVNLPHARVWIIGYKPRWVYGVSYLPTVQRGPKHANTWRNWQAMAGCADLSDRFVLFNDDFFVTRPITAIPTLHRGTLDDTLAWYARQRLAAYRQRAEYTRKLLVRAGHPGPFYSYELHTPMVMDRAALAEAVGWLDRNRTAPLEYVSKRTFYGNWARAQGERAHDIKVQKSAQGLPQSPLPFLSTAPASWSGLTGGWVRRQFAVPSVYETRGEVKYRPPTTAGSSRG